MKTVRINGAGVKTTIGRAEGPMNEVLSGLFSDLYKLTGSTASVEFEEEVGEYGCWVGGDLIGSGASQSEAVEDAIKTARGWESN